MTWAGMKVQKRSLSLDATITGSADTNGTACTPINIGAALPAGALVTACVVTLTTQGSGGSVTAANLDVGWSGSTEVVMKDLDLVASTGGGAKYSKGSTAVNFPVSASAKQLQAIVTPDGSHQLSGLTALAATIDVYFVVPF